MTTARTRSARHLARGILRRHGALTPDPLVDDIALAIDAAARGALAVGDGPEAADWRKLALDLGNAVNAVEGAMRAADEAWNPLIAFGHVRIELWQALGDAVTSAAMLARRVEGMENVMRT